MSNEITRMRFLTLGGATVVVTQRSSSRTACNYAWQCLGCWMGDTEHNLPEASARDKANRHAGGCRSMPRP